MAESEVFSFMKDIVNGFIEIGENKFLHRDLKLANILVSEKGVAKIADFGFSKLLGNDNMASTMLGSPLNMAPEYFIYIYI